MPYLIEDWLVNYNKQRALATKDRPEDLGFLGSPNYKKAKATRQAKIDSQHKLNQWKLDLKQSSKDR